MRRLRALLVLSVATTAWPITPSAAQEPPRDDDGPGQDRLARLREAVHNVVHGPALRRSRVGLMLASVADGRVLYAERASTAMDPASNQKLLASVAALHFLGSRFRFATEVHGVLPDGSGVLAGDLVLRGSGDPSLSAADLENLARALAARGVTRVEGDVVADPRRLGREAAREAAPEEEPDGHAPLQVAHSALIVRVRPGAQVGAPARVLVAPLEDAVRIRSRVRTVRGGRSRLGVRIEAEAGTLVVVATGQIALAHPGAMFRRRPPSSMLYAAMLLHDALVRAGIQVRGRPRVGSVGGAPVRALAVHRSAPLPQLLHAVNKHSNNDYADRLLETVGAEVYGGPATMRAGLRALGEALDALGLPRAAFASTNGSGLGHGNRVTAEGLIALLRTVYFDPRIGPEIMQSLSLGGVDGTTRNRFRGSPAAHLVRAKTGTLNGKSILSGFVGRAEPIAFSILIDRLGRRGLQVARAAQVRIVEAALAYLEGAQGAAPADEAPPVDFEVDESEVEIDDLGDEAASDLQPGVGG